MVSDRPDERPDGRPPRVPDATRVYAVGDIHGAYEEFRALLANCDHFTLPLMAGKTEEDIADPGPDRDLQYAQLGAWLAAWLTD